jgi:hypothetical protein
MTITDAEATSILLSSRRMTDVRAGGNSRVVRVDMGGTSYAVKDYSRRSDGRARLEREWLSLDLLATRLPGLVPEPIWRDGSVSVAIHSWLPGAPPELDDGAVSAMLTWMAELHELHHEAPHVGFPAAVDAVASVVDAAGQVRARCEALRGTAGAASCEPLRSGVNEVLAELDAVMSTRFSAASEMDGPSCMVETLSPSDFGPHNLLHDPPSRTYRLVDLEFFGIDDAHKLVCDTILHPQNTWTARNLERFVDGAHAALGTTDARLERLLPVLSLKWATIVLARIAREGPCANLPRRGDDACSRGVDFISQYLRLSRSARLQDALRLVCEDSSRPALPDEAIT